MEAVISSEESAFALLKQALEGEIANEEHVALSFESWPQLQICLRGEGYESTITPEVASAIIHLQQAINRAYSRIVHHHADARSLRDSEKNDIRLKAKVEQGSSLVTIDMSQLAQTIAQQVIGKMTGTEIVLTLLGFSLSAGGVFAYKAFLQARSQDKAIDAQTTQNIAMSEQETERMKIFAAAISRNSIVAKTNADFEDARHELVKCVADAESIEIQGTQVSKAAAKTMAANKRSESLDKQLNDIYVILSVDHRDDEEVKLRLSRVQDGMEFNARFKDHSLNQQEIEKLKNAQWSRSQLYMSINATELRGEITSASIVGVDLQN